MSSFAVTMRGRLPDGREYKVVRRSDGWTRAYVGGKRRSMRWLKEALTSDGQPTSALTERDEDDKMLM